MTGYVFLQVIRSIEGVEIASKPEICRPWDGVSSYRGKQRLPPHGPPITALGAGRHGNMSAANQSRCNNGAMVFVCTANYRVWKGLVGMATSLQPIRGLFTNATCW